MREAHGQDLPTRAAHACVESLLNPGSERHSVRRSKYDRNFDVSFITLG